jgi:hypothetical protein
MKWIAILGPKPSLYSRRCKDCIDSMINKEMPASKNGYHINPSLK